MFNWFKKKSKTLVITTECAELHGWRAEIKAEDKVYTIILEPRAQDDVLLSSEIYKGRFNYVYEYHLKERFYGRDYIEVDGGILLNKYKVSSIEITKTPTKMYTRKVLRYE